MRNEKAAHLLRLRTRPDKLELINMMLQQTTPTRAFNFFCINPPLNLHTQQPISSIDSIKKWAYTAQTVVQLRVKIETAGAEDPNRATVNLIIDFLNENKKTI